MDLDPAPNFRRVLAAPIGRRGQWQTVVQSTAVC